MASDIVAAEEMNALGLGAVEEGFDGAFPKFYGPN